MTLLAVQDLLEAASRDSSGLAKARIGIVLTPLEGKICKLRTPDMKNPKSSRTSDYTSATALKLSKASTAGQA